MQKAKFACEHRRVLQRLVTRLANLEHHILWILDGNALICQQIGGAVYINVSAVE